MFKLLDTVALTHDIALAGLRCGSLGAIVEVVAEDEFEVEFTAGRLLSAATGASHSSSAAVMPK